VRRQWLFTMVMILALAIAAAGCGGKGGKKEEPVSSGPSAEVLAEGKDLFQQSCSACHGSDGKGLPGLGKDLTTSEFVKGLTDDELLEFVKRGRPASDPQNTTGVDMPPKGGNPALTDDQIKAIITYIRSIQE